MPIPSEATVFETAADPADRVDWQIDLGDKILEAGESVWSWTLTVDSAAVALGVAISTEAGYTAALVNSNRSLRFWLEVASGFQSNSAFDGEGINVGLTLQVVTDSVPTRRVERTFVVEMRNL